MDSKNICKPINMASSNATCRFCQYFSDNKSQTRNIDTPWLMGKEFAALVSVGALVPGWSLVCPTEHVLNLCNHYSKDEFWKFTNEVVQTLTDKYGAVRIFEHGAFSQDSVTGCGTGHAHLHVVPLNFELEREAMSFDDSLQWNNCNIEEINSMSAGKEYLFMADQYNGSHTVGKISTMDAPVSQFFRRVIAARLGIAESFDYKQHPMLDISETTARELQYCQEMTHDKACNY